MSQRGLEALLRPKSIAVVGASMKPDRAGFLMMRNLLAGGFAGPVLPVTPAYKAVLGVLARPDIASLPFTPDLAVLCTHARRNLDLLDALGQKGVKPALFFLLHLSSMPTYSPAPAAIRCGYWVQIAPGLLAPMARAERQFFSGADYARQTGIYFPVRRGF